MLGNVWEWTCSRYLLPIHKKSYDGSEQKCSVSADYYSLRGGSWNYDLPRWVRAAIRNYFNPDFRSRFIGFCLVRD